MKVSKRCILLFAVLLIISLITLNVGTVSTVLLGIKGTIVDGNLIKFSGTAGVGEDAGVAASNVTKNKFDATSAPTVNNDTDEGYTVGSKWYDVTADLGYVCLDNTDGAAVWIEITSLGTTTFTGLTDTPANYTGEAGRYVKVNVGEDALEFGTVAGEANTASNIGEEVEIYKQKTAEDLEFRTLKADSDKITISNATDAVLKISNEVETNSDYVFSGQHAGQYWLAGSTYTLGIIKVYMSRYNDGSTIKMQIYEADVDGYPTGVELGSIEIDCTQISTDLAWIDWDLTSEDISVTSATKYCWYLTGETVGHGIKVRYANTDQVADAWRLWYATGAWSHNATNDDTFKIYSAAVPLNYIKFDIVESEMDVVNLLSTTTVAFNADADTTLYTVPTGKRCVLTKVIVVAAGDAGATTTVSIGQNTAETDFIPANTLSNLDAQYDSVILQPIPNTTPLKIKSYAAEIVVEARVANQSGAAGNTIYLFGILY